MTWVRKDDQMPINRKVAPLSDAAYRLDDEAICWASRNGTDGRIAADELDNIPVRAVSRRTLTRSADELVGRRRWHRAEDPPCPSEYCPEPGPDGWVIHDYLEYNPTAEQVRAERKAKADRQKRWRDSRRGSSPSRNGAGDGLHDASRDGERDAPHDASRNAPGDAAPRARVSRPVPPRPAPKEGGGGAPAAPDARRQAADATGDGWEEDQPPPPAPPVPSNGRADLAEARAAITAAQRAHRRGPSHDGAFEALRAATPDLPPLVEDPPPEEQP